MSEIPKPNNPLNRFLTRKGVNRLREGHPWIDTTMLKPDWDLPSSPAIVPVGEHWFAFNPANRITLRRIGPAARHWPDPALAREPVVPPQDMPDALLAGLEAHLVSLYTRKQKLLDETCFRWVFGDSDGFPGLVIDVYDDVAVVQVQAAWLELFWSQLSVAIQSAFVKAANRDLTSMVVRRDSSARKQEGLPIDSHEPDDTARAMEWQGLQWHMTPQGNQKTGAYFDQRDNHRRAIQWAQQLGCKSAWDVFCYHGGFGMHLAKAGLKVLGVDQSEQALAIARANAEVNSLTDNLSVEKHDAFAFMRAQDDSKARIDMVVLDPPPLARLEKEKFDGLRGYRELNLRALKCLNPGGLLVTCSCSHVIGQDDMIAMLQQASHHTRTPIRIIEMCGPAPDHAAHPLLPESNYLKALFVQVG